jgi:hypothetical protein
MEHRKGRLSKFLEVRLILNQGQCPNFSRAREEYDNIAKIMQAQRENYVNGKISCKK